MERLHGNHDEVISFGELLAVLEDDAPTLYQGGCTCGLALALKTPAHTWGYQVGPG